MPLDGDTPELSAELKKMQTDITSALDQLGKAVDSKNADTVRRVTHAAKDRVILVWREIPTVKDAGVPSKATDAGLAAVRAWWRNSRGPIFPFAFVLDEDVNEGVMARWASTLDPTLAINDRNTMPIAIEELSRGLVL